MADIDSFVSGVTKVADRRTLLYNGESFEFELMDHLRAVMPEAIILHDLKLYSAYLGKDTQIDLAVITKKAVFIIEAKNWKYWVSGEYSDYEWSGKSRDNKIMKVFNPIHQNFIHIRALRNAMRGIGFNPVPFYNVVVVPDGTEIKSNCKEVMNFSKLMRFVQLSANTSNEIDMGAYRDCMKKVCY